MTTTWHPEREAAALAAVAAIAKFETCDAVAEMLGLSLNTTRLILKKLERDGKIARKRRGCWMVYGPLAQEPRKCTLPTSGVRTVWQPLRGMMQ